MSKAALLAEVTRLRAENQRLTIARREQEERLQQQVRELSAHAESQQQEIEYLRQLCEEYRRRIYGRSSERLQDGQLLLEFAADGKTEEITPPAHVEEAPDDEGPAYRRKKGAHGRMPLPAHLRRERIEYLPPEKDRTCSCCGQPMTPIGEEVTEELDYVPASFLVREHVRPKFACSKCQEGVVIAPLPDRPIEKGRMGPGLLAHIVVSKYADHLPLHRQEGIYRRDGLELSKSTLCDGVADVAELMQPVYEQLRKQVLASKAIQTDDTPVLLRHDAEAKSSKRCFLFAYGGDGRDWVYEFTSSRSRAGPLDFFGDYHGYGQADAWGGYDELFRSRPVIEVGCWAHARRYFVEALSTAPQDAAWTLALIRELYQVEDGARDLSAEERRQRRQGRSRAVLGLIEEHLRRLEATVLPKSPLGKAVRYALGNWQALSRYLEDGDLKIDNNGAENALRGVAVGRKNWLFAGSRDGGQRAAVLYSLIYTCKVNGVEPFAYLRDVIARVNTHPMSRIEELTPRGWKAAQATAAAQTA